MRSVEMILSRKPTPNTYKFAVVRALADKMRRRFGPEDPIVSGAQPETISFRELALQVLSYYWPIVLSSRLRQSIDPAMEPNVMVLIREEAAQLGLSSRLHLYEYVRSHSDRHEAVISRCCTADSFLVDTIKRLHEVTYYRVDPRLYEVRDEEVQLSTASVEFLVRNSTAVADLSIRYWARFTESLTSAPKIIEKIEGGIGWTDENVRKRYSHILRGFWGDACFFCARTTALAPTQFGMSFLSPTCSKIGFGISCLPAAFVSRKRANARPLIRSWLS